MEMQTPVFLSAVITCKMSRAFYFTSICFNTSKMQTHAEEHSICNNMKVEDFWALLSLFAPSICNSPKANISISWGSSLCCIQSLVVPATYTTLWTMQYFAILLVTVTLILPTDRPNSAAFSSWHFERLWQQQSSAQELLLQPWQT